jgi:hypothetical protein
MVKWKYTINSGTALREAIDNEDTEQVVECLLRCCGELIGKLRGEDKTTYGLELDDIYVALICYEHSEDEEEDAETINDYLEEFYNLCDEVRAFVAL